MSSYTARYPEWTGEYAPCYERPEFNLENPDGYAQLNQHETGSDDEDEYLEVGEGDKDVDEPRSDAFGAILLLCALLSLVGMFVSGFFGGSISSLSHMINYSGLSCGWDGPVSHLPYLYYPLSPKDGTKLLESHPTCVEKCPSAADEERRGYIKVSDAKALNVGSSSAVVSLLYNVRSPVYASWPDTNLICVPKSPVLSAALKRALRASPHVSYVRSMASTIAHSAVLCAGMLVLTCIVSFLLQYLLRAYPRSTTHTSYAVAGSLMILHGLRCFAQYGFAFITQSLLCVVAGYAILLLYRKMHRKIKGGIILAEELQGDLDDICYSFSVAPSMCLAALAVIYVWLFSFCWSQSKLAIDDSDYINFELDPNGGLRVRPLEMKARFTNASFFGLLAINLSAILILETLVQFHHFISLHSLSRKISLVVDVQDSVTFGLNRIGHVCLLGIQRAVARIPQLLAELNLNIRQVTRWTSPYTIHEMVSRDMTFFDGALSADMYVRSLNSLGSTCFGMIKWTSMGAYFLIFSLVFTFSSSVMLLAHDFDGQMPRSKIPFEAALVIAGLATYLSCFQISRTEREIEGMLYFNELRGGQVDGVAIGYAVKAVLANVDTGDCVVTFSKSDVAGSPERLSPEIR